MNRLFIVILWLTSLVATFFISRCSFKPETINTTDTIITTKVITSAIGHDSVIYRHDTVKLPIIYEFTETINTDHYYTDTIRDSVTVDVPIMRKTYKGDDYYAVISGFRPNLDTLNIINRTITKTVDNRLGFGLSLGYSMTNKGVTPYIGIGLNYNIFTWKKKKN